MKLVNFLPFLGGLAAYLLVWWWHPHDKDHNNLKPHTSLENWRVQS